MLLLIDNYDSFTWNLAQYFAMLGEEPCVLRNDEIDADGVNSLLPDAICISPGPGHPGQAGHSLAIIASALGRIPVLGVCLGHQAIAQHFGAKIVRAPRPMHGKVSEVRHHATGIFAGLPSPLRACRYHSLAVEPSTLHGGLQASAWAEDGTIMGIEHATLPVWGVQFHPEAILTEYGHALLGSFLTLARQFRSMSMLQHVSTGDSP